MAGQLYHGVRRALRLPLRPSHSDAQAPDLSVSGWDVSQGGGLRFIPDILKASAQEYLERWNTAQIGQINREVALHVQALERVNEIKFRALDRVYKGLLALTCLTAGLVIVLAYFSLAR